MVSEIITRMVEVTMLNDQYWVRVDAEREASPYTKEMVMKVLRLHAEEENAEDHKA